jgi:hypothetical protein
MANALFDSGRDGFLNGEFNWSSDLFKVILLSNQYTVDLINHATTASVGGTVAISGVMTTITPGKGVADADDFTILLKSLLHILTHHQIYQLFLTEVTLLFNGVTLQIESSSSRFSRAFFIGKSGLKIGILTIEITL